MSQDQVFMETEHQAMASSNQSYAIFSESEADLRDLLEQACLDMATKLWERDLIADQLYDNITNRDAVYSEHERTRAMLKTIYSKLKTSNAPAIMKAFIAVLRKESVWYDMAAVIEQAVEKAKDDKVVYPEATVLKRYMSNLADSIGGSLVSVANHAESQRILTTAEKQRFTDANNRHDQLYTQKLMDQVGILISKDEKVFDQFVGILKYIGGPPSQAATYLSDKKSSTSTC